ncbi:MAG: endonuclease III domain-containing protein [Thermodesulfobacteriota bacterium]
MDNGDMPGVFKILRKVIAPFTTPAVTRVSETTRDPFRVLISCILSLRTRDGTTGAASERLFRLAKTPTEMRNLPHTTIEKAIYPVGFYRNKAGVIRELCATLVERYDSVVPETVEELLTLKGVGRKTANLVVTRGYGKPGICVDTHVHRITNRWGYVATKKPDETEFALRKVLPKRYWIPINDLLVTFGQNICKPISPFCSRCRLFKYCERVGVGKSR